MESVISSRILTIPNAITILRALGVPLFLYTYLHLHHPLISFWILGLGAVTDYLDGKLARILHQESKLGAALDPAIDRLYIVSTIIALALHSVIPWWIVVALLSRDLILALILAAYRKTTGNLFVVTYLGKAATFNLLYAFPMLLLSGSHGIARIWGIFGWAFVIWGVGLYLLTGFQYAAIGLTSIIWKRGQTSFSSISS
jgi:cardiolipin synthase